MEMLDVGRAGAALVLWWWGSLRLAGLGSGGGGRVMRCVQGRSGVAVAVVVEMAALQASRRSVLCIV